jgi:CDP-glucose 4,6-dehydratase
MGIKKTFWFDKKVLVTGGSGFVGYHLALTLEEAGARVVVLDIKNLPKFSIKKKTKNKIKFIKGSVASPRTVNNLFKKEKFDTVFHLAAEAIVSRALEKPAEALDTNIRGTWLILEASRINKVKEVIVASSDKAYGIHDNLPYKENYALQGKYPYECSKSCTDLVAQMYSETYKLPVVIARCGNIYGEGDMNGTRLIPDFFRTIFHKKTFIVRSNGKFLRDFIHVDDIVRAYMVLAEQLEKKKLMGHAFNFAHNKPLSVIEVLNLIKKVKKDDVAISIENSAKYEIPDQYLDWSKAKKILNWKPEVSHERGFINVAAWYHDFFKNGGKLEK